MSRPTGRLPALLMLCVLAASGCHPTQPFYFHEDGDLSSYIDRATELEYPDIETESLAEVTQALPPHTLTDPEFRESWDLRLEDVVSIALNNSKVIRNLGSLTQFTIADGLVGRTALSATVYDPAIFETDPQFGSEAALSNFDAQFSTSVFWQKTDRPQNVDTTIGTFIPFLFQQDLGQFDASLTKQTAGGTIISVRNQTIYDQNNRGFGRALPSDWFTAFELEATQPILRGRGSQVNRAPVILARIRTDVSLADFEIAVRDMIMDIENAYWDLHLSYRALSTAKIGRDSALVTWRNAFAKRLGGAETAQAEAQSREQYFFFRSQVETSLRDLYNSETRLRWLMGLTPTDHRMLRPVQEPSIAQIQFNWTESHTEAQIRSAELRRQKWVIKQRQQEMIVARNQILPQLDITATARWLGMGDDLIQIPRNGANFVTPGSLAFDELTEGRYQETRLGLQFTPPRVGARREQAGIRNAKYNLAREHARLEDMELNVSHILTTSLNNLDYFYNVAQTHFNRWAAAEEEVNANQALVEVNRATVDLLLQSQQRRAQAQIDFYRAVIDYNKAIADVHYRKGTLLEYNNIQLAEGPWPNKAYWDALGHARERDASYYWNYGNTRPRVISRGPIDQPMTPMDVQDSIPYEVIPTPEPTPAAPPTDTPMPMLERITQSPATLNGPQPGLIPTERDSFDWGLKLGAPSTATGARQASHTPN